MAKKKPTSLMDTGRLSVGWREDPIILERMRETQRLMLEGLNSVQICLQLGVGYTTTRRDMGRLQELWLEEAGEEVSELRHEALAFYLSAQRDALKRFNESQSTTDLRLATDINDRIVSLLGLSAPQRIDLGGSIAMEWQDDGPLGGSDDDGEL